MRADVNCSPFLHFVTVLDQRCIRASVRVFYLNGHPLRHCQHLLCLKGIIQLIINILIYLKQEALLVAYADQVHMWTCRMSNGGHQ